MADYGEQFLSRILDDGTTQAIRTHSVEESDFATDTERKVFRFITDYAQENRGQAPDYRTVVERYPEFYYREGVADSYSWMVKRMKSNAGKRAIVELLSDPKTQKQLDELDGNDFIELLQNELNSITMRTSVRDKPGKTLDEIKQTMKDEYLKREEGKSFKAFDTPFQTFTKEVGQWYSGDVYGIMGESGRGKTYLVVRIIDSLLRQGANVLAKSFEVKEYVFISRLISVATAVDEMFIDELERKIGIPNKAILSGKLDGVVRDKFFEVLDVLEDYYEGTLYFQGKSDSGLTRTLNDLDRELSTNEIDAVFLDPFYGLSDVYGKNSNKTTGGAAEQAATRFENIIGDHDVIGFYTVQATVDKPNVSEEGLRELELPSRDQVKTSKRLLDIATVLIGFDSVEKEGNAIIGVSKGRNGGEDFTLELIALFDYGVLKELPSGDDIPPEAFTQQF